MRIAQVAPLYESVPPQLYGGTERVVSYLTEELVAAGHAVTLFASGDSRTAAELVSVSPRALRLDEAPWDAMSAHALLLERVAQRAHEFDVIHFHIDAVHLPLARRLTTPSVSTLHGRLDLSALPAVYREFSEHPLVSISDAQRMPLPDARWAATIHHGLPSDLYTQGDGSGGYLAFLGRISPEKRLDRAIAIAEATHTPLRVAAKVDAADREYFEREIEPLLASPLVQFVGEISDAEKQEFLGNALGLLFPIDWPEPFGLVMIEAMACGTPVVAFSCGSVPEVLRDGVSGFVVDSLAGAIEAVERLRALDRGACRAEFEQRFTATRMARDYAALYERLGESRVPADLRAVEAVAIHAERAIA
jgi:glycosyltransferase involved in cell wall biosynthesis